jgi:hypothetical protein
MERQVMGELHKIKWSGENIISISHILHMLLIRCNAKYHVTIWCEMQTIIWMSYSDSTHFSDKLSYKILVISSYGLKDMILTRFAYLQQFQKNRGGFFSPSRTQPKRMTHRATGDLIGLLRSRSLRLLRESLTARSHMSARLKREKDMISCKVQGSNSRPAR